MSSPVQIHQFGSNIWGILPGIDCRQTTWICRIQELLDHQAHVIEHELICACRARIACLDVIDMLKKFHHKSCTPDDMNTNLAGGFSFHYHHHVHARSAFSNLKHPHDQSIIQHQCTLRVARLGPSLIGPCDNNSCARQSHPHTR